MIVIMIVCMNGQGPTYSVKRFGQDYQTFGASSSVIQITFWPAGAEVHKFFKCQIKEILSNKL